MNVGVFMWEIGSKQTIKCLEGDQAVVERLREFGFIPGEEFVTLHKSPFGEPTVIQIRDTSVALRKLELLCIKVK